MKILKAKPGQKLFLGHQGESLALTVIFNIEPWIELYGLGTAHLLHQRNGDAEPYPVATVQDGTEVSWAVTDADTAMDGEGKYELRYYVGETLAKSDKGETYTYKALQYGAQPPEPIQGWLDHVAEKEHELLEAVGEAKAASEQAAGSAGDALSFANAAEESAQNAGIAVKNASDLATNADLSAKEAAGQSKAAADSAAEAKKAEEAAKKAAEETGGVNVTAKPGQLIRVKSVDENGKPTAWEAVPWGYTEGEKVEILPEITFTEENIREVFEALPSLGLVLGDTYIVNMNGTENSIVAGVQNVNGTVSAVSLVDPNGMWVIVDLPKELAAQAGFNVIVEGNLAFPSTVSIYQDNTVTHPIPGKLLPEGVPYVEQGEMVEVLPECQPTYDEDDGSFYNIQLQGVISAGDSCTVNWNGTEYACIAQDLSAMIPGAILLGDGTNYGVTGNGEPFAFVAMEQNGAFGGMVMPLDGTTDLTISIRGNVKIYHKLDKGLLPSEAVNNLLVVNKAETDENGNYVATHNFMEIFSAQSSGKAVFLNMNDVQYTYAGSNYDAQLVYFVSTRYNSGDGNLFYEKRTIDANGIIQTL